MLALGCILKLADPFFDRGDLNLELVELRGPGLSGREHRTARREVPQAFLPDAVKQSILCASSDGPCAPRRGVERSGEARSLRDSGFRDRDPPLGRSGERTPRP